MSPAITNSQSAPAAYSSPYTMETSSGTMGRQITRRLSGRRHFRMITAIALSAQPICQPITGQYSAA